MAFVDAKISLIRRAISQVIVCLLLAPHCASTASLTFLADIWFRFVVKQTYEVLRPKQSFIKHDSSGVQVHTPASAKHGWEWYEMGIFVRWLTSGQITVFFCNAPQKLSSSLELMLPFNIEKIVTSNPYSVSSLIIDEIIALYDQSVWSLRNHISNQEAVKFRYSIDPSCSQPANITTESRTRARLSSSS
jgi:hypothetical protein